MRFNLNDVSIAFDEWGFNCGPASVCALLELTPNELRPRLGDFETKRYTNPTLMSHILKTCGYQFSQVFRSDDPEPFPKVEFGLIRLQWSGPWTKPGVPIAARYRHSHWIAARNLSSRIFDINAMSVGGWLSFSDWSNDLVPWLLRQCCQKGDGGWWATHAIEVRS